MRSIELAKVAAKAECIRLNALSARQGRRAFIVLAALICAVAAYALAHVALFMIGAPRIGALQTALVLLCLNLAAAAILGSAAAFSRPSGLEREAEQLRRNALRQAGQSLPIDLLAQALGAFIPSRRLNLVLQFLSDIVSWETRKEQKTWPRKRSR